MLNFNILILILILVLLLYLILNLKKENFSNKFKPKRKFLIFSSIGKRQTDIQAIDLWKQNNKKRNFDIVLYYYKGDIPENCVDYCVKREGTKFDNFYDFITKNDISKYKGVWVVDDDIQIKTEDINTMFLLFEKYKLDIGQPSFTKKSLISHPHTIQNKNNLIRYTNFIENGVFILSYEAIQKIKGVFKNAKSGWGLDYICCKKLDNKKNIAIIDKVACLHPHSKSSLNEIIPRGLHPSNGDILYKEHKIKPYTIKIYRAIKKN